MLSILCTARKASTLRIEAMLISVLWRHQQSDSPDMPKYQCTFGDNIEKHIFNFCYRLFLVTYVRIEIYNPFTVQYKVTGFSLPYGMDASHTSSWSVITHPCYKFNGGLKLGNWQVIIGKCSSMEKGLDIWYYSHHDIKRNLAQIESVGIPWDSPYNFQMLPARNKGNDHH